MFLDELPSMEDLTRKVGAAAGKKSPKKANAALPDPDQGDQPDQPDQPEQPKPQQAAAQRQQGASPWQHPAAQQHFGAFGDMIKSTNDAWREEMNSRVAQTQAQAEREHEQQLAMINNQGQQQQAAQAQAQAESQARIQKNNAIMGMMGYGTKVVNGRRIGPFESFSQSLLGR